MLDGIGGWTDVLCGDFQPYRGTKTAGNFQDIVPDHTNQQVPLSIVARDAGATWNAALNAGVNVDVSSGNATIRLRVRFRDTANGATGATAFKWRYSKNVGAYADLTGASANVRLKTSAYYANGFDTVELFEADGYYYYVDNNAGLDTAGTFTLGVGLHGFRVVETEACLEVVAADVANGDTLDFRVALDDGSSTPFTTYTQTPRITVVEGGGVVLNTVTDQGGFYFKDQRYSQQLAISPAGFFNLDRQWRQQLALQSEGLYLSDSAAPAALRTLLSTDGVYLLDRLVREQLAVQPEGLFLADQLYREQLHIEQEGALLGDSSMTSVLRTLALAEGFYLSDAFLRQQLAYQQEGYLFFDYDYRALALTAGEGLLTVDQLRRVIEHLDRDGVYLLDQVTAEYLRAAITLLVQDGLYLEDRPLRELLGGQQEGSSLGSAARREQLHVEREGMLLDDAALPSAVRQALLSIGLYLYDAARREQLAQQREGLYLGDAAHRESEGSQSEGLSLGSAARREQLHFDVDGLYLYDAATAELFRAILAVLAQDGLYLDDAARREQIHYDTDGLYLLDATTLEFIRALTLVLVQDGLYLDDRNRRLFEHLDLEGIYALDYALRGPELTAREGLYLLDQAAAALTRTLLTSDGLYVADRATRAQLALQSDGLFLAEVLRRQLELLGGDGLALGDAALPQVTRTLLVVDGLLLRDLRRSLLEVLTQEGLLALSRDQRVIELGAQEGLYLKDTDLEQVFTAIIEVLAWALLRIVDPLGDAVATGAGPLGAVLAAAGVYSPLGDAAGASAGPLGEDTTGFNPDWLNVTISRERITEP